jgi:hypothetical protein
MSKMRDTPVQHQRLCADNTLAVMCCVVYFSAAMQVTSALPYINNVPHLGNIIGCVLTTPLL